MSRLVTGVLAVGLFLSFGFGQTIPNIQFKDMNGKSYDLYTLLGEGKYVYFMTTFEG